MPHYFCVCFVDACRPSAFAIRKPQLDVISEATEEPSTAGMAEYLASIFGTEKDKVNCSFFFKVMVFKMLRLLRLSLPTAILKHLTKSTNIQARKSKNYLLRRARAPTERDVRGSTTSRRSLKPSCCRTSTSTRRTRPKPPTGAIWPMLPMRRCRSTMTTFSRTSSSSVRTSMGRWRR